MLIPWWVDILSAFVRAGMVALSTELVHRHILTDVQGDSLTSHVVSLVIAGAPFALAMAWSLIQKWTRRQKLETALDGIKTVIQANQKLQTGASV